MFHKNDVSIRSYCLVTEAIAEWGSQRGLSITFAEQTSLGVSVFCELQEKSVGNFEMGYQHMDGQLKDIKKTLAHLLDDRTHNQMWLLNNIKEQLDIALNLFE